jgi:hypothetical protein
VRTHRISVEAATLHFNRRVMADAEPGLRAHVTFRRKA